MSDLLSYQSFYLVGIKGVAMTSLAQCLANAGKKIQGSDVSEDFVTQPHLDKLNISIHSLSNDLPADIDCLIYTAAHQGPQNPQVLAAQQQQIPTLSHAEALADLFNQKQGVAVSGVGGKSTVSAMIVWILEFLVQKNPKQYQQQSFSVGVGDIVGLDKTGQWVEDSALFIAEADDYVTNPAAPEQGEDITARFSFLHPHLTVCTNLKYDHPDVYQDFDHTKKVFTSFFEQIKDGGSLVVNGDDQNLLQLATKVAEKKSIEVISYGQQSHNQIILLYHQINNQKSIAQFKAGKIYKLVLSIPGLFNIYNALAAITSCKMLGVAYQDSVEALGSFQSTKRRFEYRGSKNQVEYYDDYAHHPHEVAAAIEAIHDWYPGQRVVIGFQSHTYSRTKQLFDQFVQSLSKAKEVVMIDIFASAREKKDSSVSSDLLCQALKKTATNTSCQNVHTIEKLAAFCTNSLKPGDVFVTLGAGDIYKVHDLIET